MPGKSQDRTKDALVVKASELSQIERELVLERYKFIQQEIRSANENVYRFVAMYQTVATAATGAVLALFVGYRKWSIPPEVARAGVRGLLILITVVAAFCILLISIGVFSWIDYRREECSLATRVIDDGFRDAPMWRNFLRWYETYIVLFVLATVALVWILASSLLIPHMS